MESWHTIETTSFERLSRNDHVAPAGVVRCSSQIPATSKLLPTATRKHSATLSTMKISLWKIALALVAQHASGFGTVPALLPRSSQILTSRYLSTPSSTSQVVVKTSAAAASANPASPVPFAEQGSSADEEYRRGFITIAIITLANASVSPAWHAAMGGEGGPPALLLNAVVSVVAWLSIVGGSAVFGDKEEAAAMTEEERALAMRGGYELGFWKFLGTTGHLYGLSLTSADHGAFLIQLTTLIVPVFQGLQGERIPRKVQLAVGLALAGVLAFTQSGGGDLSSTEAANQALGDAICVGAAVFYSAFDIRTFKFGPKVQRQALVTNKITSQALLSVALCTAVAGQESMDYVAADWSAALALLPLIVWSGAIVNALATFFQVGGMIAIGPVKAQCIFASQPLWASMIAYFFLGETIGPQGLVGAAAFLSALYLAATTDIARPKTISDPTIPNEHSL